MSRYVCSAVLITGKPLVELVILPILVIYLVKKNLHEQEFYIYYINKYYVVGLIGIKMFVPFYNEETTNYAKSMKEGSNILAVLEPKKQIAPTE